ncbi:MAG: NAD(P)-dependent oxidoreductase [Marinilabiliales bacterium]|nr:MAG: NAD(P)-dependent oxidoreductase [Marinilabiliales bacterium]
MQHITLITGATAGIGLACAKRFAKEGHDLIVTGRRKERLEKIAAEIRQKNSVQVLSLSFDITIVNEVRDAIESLSQEWKNIEILVNNAGLAVGLNTVQEGVIDDWERMIDTNIKGLLYMSRYITPLMIEQGYGHVINIGSIAGKEVYPNGNVYCATKHAVDALSKTMRIDLVKHGIRVTQIAPGAVETEFSEVRFKGDTERAKSVYKGYVPLHSDDVAEVTFYVTTLPNHANINDLVIMPTAQASATVFKKE